MLHKAPSQPGSHTPAPAAPSVFPLSTSLEKPLAFPNQTLSFAFLLGKLKLQRAASQMTPKADPKGHQRILFHPERPCINPLGKADY